MAGFICPDCGHKTDIFIGDGGSQLARELNVTLLGSIPLDPYLVLACDTGKPLVTSDTATPAIEAMQKTFSNVLRRMDEMKPDTEMEVQNKMRIAIPLTDGQLSSHFGHCEQFAVIDVDPEHKTIINTELCTPPQHEPGILPKWLGGLCVNLVIAGGLGQRAQSLFQQNNIEVIVGAPQADSEQLVRHYLDGRLACGQNVCDH
jgi:predicted Fe-Mo cluster-binding NifX family protein